MKYFASVVIALLWVMVLFVVTLASELVRPMRRKVIWGRAGRLSIKSPYGGRYRGVSDYMDKFNLTRFPITSDGAI